MRRMDDFNYRKPSNKNNKQDKRLGVGIVFIFIGALFVMSNIGLFPYGLRHYLFSWQMILIIIGLFTLSSNKNRTVGLVLIFIGVFFILPGLFGIGRIGLGKLWPVVFVAIGAFILLRRKSEIQGQPEIPEMETRMNSDQMIDDLVIFSGSQRVITSKNFIGGRLTAIFGGIDYNFVNAEMENNQALIDIVCIFGGTKFIIPNDWDVVIDIVPIFGGFADKRNTLRHIQVSNHKKLIIKGLTLFGGGEIRSL